MKVTALIPTYNRKRQVLLAIDSILAQTVPVDEIIVVDDGSTDGTADEICRCHGSAVSVFRQDNAGASAARNRGLREARGEWVAFLDSDDVWFATKIARQFEALAAFGDEFGLCFTDCAYESDCESKQSFFRETGFRNAPRLGTLDAPATYMLVDRGQTGREPFLLPSVLVRRCLLEEINGFDEAMIIGEDSDVFFRLSLKTRFCFVAEPLVRLSTPSGAGLHSWYSTRDDRKYHSLQRLYAKWATMPELAGTANERAARDLLRLVCYDSAECKFHDLRMGSALREIARLRGLGDSYPSIISTLLSRKINKSLRAFRTPGTDLSARNALVAEGGKDR